MSEIICGVCSGTGGEHTKGCWSAEHVTGLEARVAELEAKLAECGRAGCPTAATASTPSVSDSQAREDALCEAHGDGQMSALRDISAWLLRRARSRYGDTSSDGYARRALEAAAGELQRGTWGTPLEETSEGMPVPEGERESEPSLSLTDRGSVESVSFGTAPRTSEARCANCGEPTLVATDADGATICPDCRLDPLIEASRPPRGGRRVLEKRTNEAKALLDANHSDQEPEHEGELHALRVLGDLVLTLWGALQDGGLRLVARDLSDLDVWVNVKTAHEAWAASLVGPLASCKTDAFQAALGEIAACAAWCEDCEPTEHKLATRCQHRHGIPTFLCEKHSAETREVYVNDEEHDQEVEHVIALRALGLLLPVLSGGGAKP